MRPALRIFIVVFMLLAVISPVMAASVTLAWDSNTEPDLAGYKVYYGTSSRVYGTPIILGLTTTTTLMGIVPGVKYYFAVTAYNASGQESGYSNEVIIPDYDVNGDGVLNVNDVVALINKILDRKETIIFDLNLDGQVDMKDVVKLINCVLDGTSCP